MERGLFELETDDELMLMCTLLNPKVCYVEMYVTQNPSYQELKNCG